MDMELRMLSRDRADRYQAEAESPMLTLLLFIASAVASVAFVVTIILAV
jgi:hypothetical protein